jgi:hypothetical protein
MSLQEEIKSLSGNKRRFFLLRLADMDTGVALKFCNITRGAYNNWLQDQSFIELYHKKEDLSAEYKQEAIQLLRRDNQLEAVILESKILRKMKEDLEQPVLPDGSIVRTNLAREVYSKLISDIDQPIMPKTVTLQQRIAHIFNYPNDQLPEGEVIDGEFSTDNQQETEHQESQFPQEGEQGLLQIAEETEETEDI